MAKRRKRRASGPDDWTERHVRIHHWVMKSAAWKDLRPTARAMLVHLYSLFNGVNNGELFLSVRDAALGVNVTPNTALKALKELEAHGFIRAALRGAFTLKHRHATTWVLTEFGYANQIPTKDFMRWQPPDKNQKPASNSTTDGINICDRRARNQAA